jgi:hypothetical protein
MPTPKDHQKKSFEIWAKRKEYGDFITYDRTKIIDVVSVESQQEIDAYIKYLHIAGDKTAYAIPVMSDGPNAD